MSPFFCQAAIYIKHCTILYDEGFNEFSKNIILYKRSQVKYFMIFSRAENSKTRRCLNLIPSAGNRYNIPRQESVNDHIYRP